MLLSLRRWLQEGTARTNAAELEARADLRRLVGSARFWLAVFVVVALTLHLYSQGRITW